MSLIPFLDSFYDHPSSLLWPTSYYRRSWLEPVAQTTRLLDTLVDDSIRTMANMQRGLGEINLTDDGNFSCICNVAGYKPEELKVDMEGNQLVVRGEHEESREGESVRCSFQRRVVHPEGATQESVKCDVDANGLLKIEARRPLIESQKTQSSPIGMKHGGAEQQKLTAQGNDARKEATRG
ncbi:small HSP21-like protein [Aphelenchoides avenae]|nr:small HSP21-like protein [Aphelenchus avenae]